MASVSKDQRGISEDTEGDGDYAEEVRGSGDYAVCLRSGAAVELQGVEHIVSGFNTSWRHWFRRNGKKISFTPHLASQSPSEKRLDDMIDAIFQLK